jgi:hypothetical protein
MAITNVPAELWVEGRPVGRGRCHLIRRDGDEAGTLSGITWLAAEPDLSGQPVLLKLADGRDLPATVSRQSHPEGRTILRFSVEGTA